MKVYSLAKVWLIIIVIFGGAMALGFTYALLFIFLKGIIENPEVRQNWILAPMFLVFVLFLVYTLAQSYKSKLYIEKDRLKLTGAFNTRELLFTEIKGFRATDKYLVIFPLSETGRKINISTYFEKSSEIHVWLNNQFKDLDKTEREAEEQEILADVNFGQSTEERSQAFDKAKKTARIASIAGIAIAALLFIANDFPRYTVAAAVIYPLIIVIILRYSKGLIRLGQRKNSPYPSIAIGLLVPVFGLLMKCMIGFHILSHSGIWQPACLIAGVLFVLLLVKSKEMEKFSAQAVLLVVLYAGTSFAYGYSTLIGYNRFYDDSKSVQYTAKVLEKRVVTGKSKTYYITLAPWGPVKNYNEVSVSRNLYNNSQIDDEVYIFLHAGKLNVPWYVITSK